LRPRLYSSPVSRPDWDFTRSANFPASYDGMLNLSRISSARMNIGRVNLSDLADSTIGELKASQPERRAKVTVALGMTAVG
jgi:hypothetical protein